MRSPNSPLMIHFPRWSTTRFSAIAVMVALGALVHGAPVLAQKSADGPGINDLSGYDIAIYDRANVLTGSSQPGSFSKAQADSHYIYGGPGGEEGEFETLLGEPDWGGWISEDLTELPPHFHVSTFNAENMGAGIGNHAMWCGVELGEPGFATAPGYGDNWNDFLDFRLAVDPSQSHTVRWELDLNYDTEPGFDFFFVRWNQGGAWVDLATFTGSNRDTNGVFVDPVHVDQTWTYQPQDLVGAGGDEIHLRLFFASDPGASDQDGFWNTDGAVQLDDIRVTVDGGVVSFADFEGGAKDDGGWVAIAGDFVGDFAKLYAGFQDLDPCRNNPSWQANFIDDGTPPNNSTESTGGSVSGTWAYGVQGGFVTNYTGGLTNGAQGLNNQITSPAFPYDDPGTAIDDNIGGGAIMRLSVWQHMPLLNGMFWIWQVRSFPDPDSGTWSPWLSRNFVYYTDNPLYTNVINDVSDLMVPAPEQVQMSLAVLDLAGIFGFPGNDATPAPTFDHVWFLKYSAAGPAFSTRGIDIFNDIYPNSGGVDYGNPVGLSCRLDQARDNNTALGAMANIAGDSIVVDVQSVVPGTTLVGNPSMEWILDANPAFDDVRVMPPGASIVGTKIGPDGRSWNQWRGSEVGGIATANGVPVDNRYWFDFPNEGPGIYPHHSDSPPMFFPGDRIRYHISATDSDGNTTTLPANIQGFNSGVGYSRTFTIRALPSLYDPQDDGTVEHANMLLVNDFGHRGGEDEYMQAFQQNGFVEDIDFDTYTVKGPSSEVGNGIGSAGVHGANADQLAGYNIIVYVSGNLDVSLADGSSTFKGDDIGVLTEWHNQPADRYAAWFGDNIASSMIDIGIAGQTYLNNVLGVDGLSDDVLGSIGVQTAPQVLPTIEAAGTFIGDYIAFGGCLSINDFDHILPLNGADAVRSHEFADPDGLPGAYTPAASVWRDREQPIGADLWRRVDVTFPYDLMFVQSVMNKAPQGASARAVLLGEILQSFGQPPNNGGAVDNPALPDRELVALQNFPNPFNPVTRIDYVAPQRGRLTVRIYNPRGELVMTLIDENVAEGPGRLTWDGKDNRGRRVSSGVYLYRVSGFGQTVERKMALVK